MTKIFEFIWDGVMKIIVFLLRLVYSNLSTQHIREIRALVNKCEKVYLTSINSGGYLGSNWKVGTDIFLPYELELELDQFISYSNNSKLKKLLRQISDNLKIVWVNATSPSIHILDNSVVKDSGMQAIDLERARKQQTASKSGLECISATRNHLIKLERFLIFSKN